MLVIGPTIEIVRVREFPADIRERLGGDASDYIVSDANARINSLRIGEALADLLTAFKEPNTVAAAVFLRSQETGEDAQALLQSVYPSLREFRESGVLVDSSAAIQEAPSWTPGERIGDLTVVGMIGGVSDTEVLRVSSPGGTILALKRLTARADAASRRMLALEAVVLRALSRSANPVSPRFVDAQLQDPNPYITMEFIDGVALARRLHATAIDPDERCALFEKVAEAYARLHSAGVLHGDVHPGNILVTPGSVRIVDFGGSRIVGRPELDAPRVGQVHYYEPELASMMLATERGGPPTPAGEQYAVATVLYETLANRPPLSLSLDASIALGQIMSAPPRPLADSGIYWPEVDAVLTRALAKAPADRYPSLQIFETELGESLRSRTTRFVSAAPEPPAAQVGRDSLLGSVRERFGASKFFDERPRFRGPTSSLYGGMGGVSWALLRSGCRSGETSDVADADLWCDVAIGEASQRFAFSDGSVGAGLETGKWALFHSVTGLHLLAALTRFAAGDAEAHRSLCAFVASANSALQSAESGGDEFPLDATNGLASLLLGCSVAAPIAERLTADVWDSVVEVGTRLCDAVAVQLSEFPKRNPYFGFAHGLSGALYCQLSWAEASRSLPGSRTLESLSALIDSARSILVDSVSWPLSAREPSGEAWTGWCHGSAGHILTLCTAGRVLDEQRFVDVAERAGEHLWAQHGRSGPSLCCGAAGEALALFELSRLSASADWAARGHACIRQAVEHSFQIEEAQGLFRGALGVALAAEEAADPARSRWPIVQSPLC